MIGRKMLMDMRLGKWAYVIFFLVNLIIYGWIAIVVDPEDKMNFYTSTSVSTIIIFLFLVVANDAAKKSKRLYSQLPITDIQSCIADWLGFYIFMFFYTVMTIGFTSLLENRITWDIAVDKLTITIIISLTCSIVGIFETLWYWKSKIWSWSFILVIPILYWWPFLTGRIDKFFWVDNLLILIGLCFIATVLQVWAFNKRESYLN